MAYSIRYGPEGPVRWEHQKKNHARAVGAAVLLALAALLRLVWAEGAEAAAGILASEPGTVTELAVAALAESVAAGEGWYHALAVWCRTIIDAGLA